MRSTDLDLPLAATYQLALLRVLFGDVPVGLALWDADLRYVQVNDTLAAMHGVPADRHPGRRLSDIIGELGEHVERTILKSVIASGEPVVSKEISGSLRAMPGEHTWQASYYPVHDTAGKIIGVAAVVVETTDRRRAEAQAESLLAAERAARLDAESAASRLEFLYHAGNELASTLDYRETLRRVCDLAVPRIADWAAIRMIDNGELSLAALAHSDPEKIALAREFDERWPATLEDRSSGQVVRTGQTQVMLDIPDEALAAAARSDEHLRFMRELGVRSVVNAPLKGRGGEVLGLVTLVRGGQSGRLFASEDVELAEILAARAALAIENARLHTERSHIAQTLQRSLLPTDLPEIPGAQVAVRYRPAGTYNEVGGDFYDLHQRATDEWMLVVGDVSGKGAEAAAVTALARYTLRAGALADPCPVRGLQVLNEALISQHQGRQFCTAVYARLRRDAGKFCLSLTLGGHSHPLLIRDGEIIEIGTAGTLLGVLDDPPLHLDTVELRAGDTVLFYTDGVDDVRPARTGIDQQFLRDVVRAGAHLGPDELVEHVECAAVNAQGGTSADDIALLALRVAN